MSESKDKTCGQCVLWNNDKCNWIESIRAGTLKKNDAACGEFIPGKTKEKQKKKILKDSGVTASGGCFEAVYDREERPRFLLKNSEDFSIVESVDINEETVFPKEARNIPYEPYGVYEGSVPNREDLFWKVRAEFDMWIDVESIWKDALGALVMLTYQQEKLQTVPYVFLYGDNESGKSTVLQLLKFLCYRALYGVTIPSADLYGYLEDSDSIGSILEDEVQGINKDTDKIKIYKAGYKQGAVVPRTLMTQFDRIIKYYRTFCFKACAGEQIPQVKGFNERFLFISMVEGFPQKEWADVDKEDLKRLSDLRNMLLKWRMLSRDWPLPSLELAMKGRLKELWKPILQITHGLTVHDGLFKFVEEQRHERLGLKQNTLEGHVVKVVTDLYNQGKESDPPIPFQTIWMELVHDLDGKLDDKKPHVMDTSEFFQVTKNKVGYRLREVLSGRTTVIKDRDSDGNRVSVKAYVFDEGKLKRVAKKYGYEVSTKLLSLPSSEGVQALESMEKPCKERLNDVEKGAPTPQELGALSNSVDSQKEPLEPSSIIKNAKEKSTVGETCSNSVVNKDEQVNLGIQCPHCKAKGKTMFFNNDSDLTAHVHAWHEFEPELCEVKT